MRILLCLTLLLGLISCSSPADQNMLDYEQFLVRADSLAQTDTTDNALAGRLLSDVRHEYTRIKELTDGKRVRLMPSPGWRWIYVALIVIAQAGITIWLIFLKIDVVKDKRLRRYIVDLSENEQRLRNNEQEMAELEACLRDLALEDEIREEVKLSLVALMDSNDLLHKEIDSLRTQLKGYEKRPIPRDLELLKTQDERVNQLDGQVRALASVLIDHDEVVERLRRTPKFLSDADWDYLWQLADRMYDGFSRRLNERFPSLTPADLQLCLLMRLRFTNTQVATLIAVSSASVSQQKFRLKKRLMQWDEQLFKDGETVDGFIWGC
ncbi:hypothetical protein [Bacteroides sp. UBA939]|uniref:hypothetical protein n=1 Tax=Bacteroides sp. UBA939 TaxID=1946092 RepID=UPI0032E397CB